MPNDDRDHGLVAAAQAASGETGPRIAYTVEAVTRYVVRRTMDSGRLSVDEAMGEFRTEAAAYASATALCQAEHRSLGYPLDDPRIQYPVKPARQD